MNLLVQFQLQNFDIVCSTSWASRDKCCELPGLVRSKLNLISFLFLRTVAFISIKSNKSSSQLFQVLNLLIMIHSAHASRVLIKSISSSCLFSKRDFYCNYSIKCIFSLRVLLKCLLHVFHIYPLIWA